MFSVGDSIMYGSMGVCTVTDIGVPDIPGAARTCYILKPRYVSNSKVYAPVENNPVNMRALLSPEQARSLIDDLPDIQPFPLNKERQEMYELCRSVIKSADSFILAKLLKTLYEKKTRIIAAKKTVPSAEKDFFDTAEKMLHGELATALDLPLDEVAEFIQDKLEVTVTSQVAAS